MAKMNWFLAAPLLVGALAGCLGGGSGDADSTNDDAPQSGSPTGGSFGNVSARGGIGGNSTMGNASSSQWTYDNRSGTVAGNALVVSSPEPKLESFDVAAGVQTLSLDLSADGNGITLTLRPPGCDKPDCEVDVGSAGSGGPASFDAREPETGAWKAVLRVSGGPGPVSSDYELEIGQEVVNPAPGGMGSSSGNTTTGP